MAAARIPQMNWSTDNHAEALKIFKENITVYCEDEEIDDDRKTALKILRGIGDEGTRRLNASGISDADKRNPAKLWEFFEDRLKTKVNFRVHRLHLMECRQRTNESLDDFTLRARTLAQKCEFDETEMEERLLEIIIASTPIEDFQRDLLGRAKGYKLADALNEGRRYEAIIAGRQQIRQLKDMGQKAMDADQSNIDVIKRDCGNCGTNHVPRKCPAYQATCHFCKKKGHWQHMCRQRKKQELPDCKMVKAAGTNSKQKKKLHELRSAEKDESSDDESFHTLCISSIRQEVFAKLDVIRPGKESIRKIHLKVDTGASGNTLPLRTCLKTSIHLASHHPSPTLDLQHIMERKSHVLAQ